MLARRIHGAYRVLLCADGTDLHVRRPCASRLLATQSSSYAQSGRASDGQPLLLTEQERLSFICSRSRWEVAESDRIARARDEAGTVTRRGELLNAKWTELDETTRTLHIRHSKSGEGRYVPVPAERGTPSWKPSVRARF